MPNSIKTILEKYLSNFKLYSYDETNETLYNELCNIYPTSTFEKF